NSEKTITVFDGKKKHLLTVPVRMTSIHSEKSKKVFIFVDPETGLLYRIRLATEKDAGNLRRACALDDALEK
ncbi:uncharacterized protein NEMAJ01_2237, partial [Nematocida major]